MNINPLLMTDFYKPSHKPMYPEDMTLLFSGFTPRKSRIEGVNSIVFFGLQYYIKEYLIKQWNDGFFRKPKRTVLNEYKRRLTNSIGGVVRTDHIEKLWDLGYLPIEIMALPEGTEVPLKVPAFVIYNTHPDHGWLVNYLETAISCSLWQASTSATLSKEYRKVFNGAALKTTGNIDGVNFQGHDFSMRGMSSLETAMLSGAGHLLFFDGTDTIPAIDFLEHYYNLDTDLTPTGFSIPATEHSVMCMGTKEDEIGTFLRLLSLFPEGFLGIVSDTWNLWYVLLVILPKIKKQIMARKGKVVIRPDSGDPVDILCGQEYSKEDMRSFMNNKYRDGKTYEEGLVLIQGITRFIYENGQWNLHPMHKGVIELLWDTFGGTVNEKGYKVLDSHIGAIYGDSITIERAKQINARLEAKGFASINWVAGIGSYTYQYVTRDTFGWAMKATYGELTHDPMVEGESFVESREIFKDPITDDGTKKSAKGLMAVHKDEDGLLYLKDQTTWEDVHNCEYKKIFSNGELLIDQKYTDIRALANS